MSGRRAGQRGRPLPAAYPVRGAKATYPQNIVRWLRDEHRPAELNVSERLGTWNPAKQKPPGRLHVNGRAVYWLDEAAVVHLALYPWVGGVRYYEGPLPTWVDSPRHRQIQRLARRFKIALLIWLVMGTVLGATLSSGPPPVHVLCAFVGFSVALVVAQLVVTVLRAVAVVRDIHRKERERRAGAPG